MHRAPAIALRSTILLRQKPLPLQKLHTRTYSDVPPEPQLEGERLIYSKLQERFKPSRLQVQDVSGGCGTFYAIRIASKDFANLPTVKQHRLVNQTLKEEIQGIHGLQLHTSPEDENS